MSHHDDWHNDRIKEECGIVGIYVPDEDVARLTFFSLFALQHRGQESAGIAVSNGSRVRMHKGMGLVNTVFNEEILKSLPGSMAVGHNRYSTTGASAVRNAQPIYCVSSVGEIAVAHNGNLINAIELRHQLEAEGETFDSTADSELIARLIVRHLDSGLEPIDCVHQVMEQVHGGYSVTVLTPKFILGFRDPHGLRPLSVGSVRGGHMFASESCAFEPVGGRVERELEPGEVVIIDQNGSRTSQAFSAKSASMCLFEFIYFARPDSVMYGTSLYKARERMGAKLSEEHPVEADLVVPVPDSGIPAAVGYSRATGIPFGEGMTKNRYIHRTFIQPDQQMRELGVKMKLMPLKENVEGKRIVLVDDSIVRGTTTGQIVKMMFEAGALEVHVRITAPPIKYPCYYGIDMASRSELIGANKTIEKIREHIGATSLGYLSVEGAMNAVQEDNRKFCNACFTGKYPIEVSQELLKDAFEAPHKVGQIATIQTGQLELPVE